MFKQCRGLWMLLFVALAAFVTVSFAGPIVVCGYELKQASFADLLMARAETEVATSGSARKPVVATAVKPVNPATVPVDTASKTILFIGDSMLDGLSPRMAQYAKQNGHTLYSVIWYSSTSKTWGDSDKLKHYISTIKPDYIFICLGANELFVRDIRAKRTKFVRRMLADIGNIPYIWIGPPNWKEDTGINDMLMAETAHGSFFLSKDLTLARSSDGAHPTKAASADWLDSVMRWMPRSSAHPIRMDAPESGLTARPKRVFVHNPNE